MLPPVRVVEVITGKWRAPLFQDTDEFSRLHRPHEQAFRKVGDAKTVHGRGDDMGRGAESELAFHPGVQLTPVAFELPCIPASERGQAQIDAPMSGQIPGMLRWGVRGEVFR